MAEQPPYVAFFGVMGATSAMVFSGNYPHHFVLGIFRFIVVMKLNVEIIP